MSKGDGMERVIAALGSRDFRQHKIWTTDYIRFPIMAGGKRVEVEVCQGMRGAVVFADKIDGSRTADALAYLGLSEVELLDDCELESSKSPEQILGHEVKEIEENLRSVIVGLNGMIKSVDELRCTVDGIMERVEKLETKEYLWDLNRCDRNMTPQRGKRERLVNAITAAREEEEEA